MSAPLWLIERHQHRIGVDVMPGDGGEDCGDHDGVTLADPSTKSHMPVAPVARHT